METKLAVLVVGHKSYGKSRTLKPFRGGKLSIVINGKQFFIRVMSNDDKPGDYWALIRNLKVPLAVLAFCPTFDQGEDGEAMLNTLQGNGYRLAFFVLENPYDPKQGRRPIPAHDIATMGRYGTVRIEDGTMPDTQRADDLRQFIETLI